MARMGRPQARVLGRQCWLAEERGRNPEPRASTTLSIRVIHVIRGSLNWRDTAQDGCAERFSRCATRSMNHTFCLMNASATTLYRSPERIFAAADRGETVVIRRRHSEYLLTRKPGANKLYGCLAGTIKKDTGKPAVHWRAAHAPD
jgi:hypothetical protein